MPHSLPYLDFYKHWSVCGVRLEPLVLYAQRLAVTPLLVARSLPLVAAACRLEPSSRRSAGGR